MNVDLHICISFCLTVCCLTSVLRGGKTAGTRGREGGGGGREGEEVKEEKEEKEGRGR